MDEEREYTPAQKLAIWLALTLICWIVVIFIGLVMYELFVWYIPFVMFVWEFYIQFLHKVYRGSAE